MGRPEPGESGGREAAVSVGLDRPREELKNEARGAAESCCELLLEAKTRWALWALCAVILLTTLGLVLETKIMNGGCLG